MANFGWAYVDCTDSGGGSAAGGPTGSIQFHAATGSQTGSSDLMFYSGSNLLELTGTMRIDGDLYATSYTITNVSQIDSAGSTTFGNSDDDTHIHTGSLFVGNSSNTVLQADLTNEQVVVEGFRGQYANVNTATYTASNQYYVYGVSQTGQVDMRLHSANTAAPGAILVIKDEVAARGGDSIMLNAAGSETIDGAATYEITGTMPAISLYSNGSNWFVF